MRRLVDVPMDALCISAITEGELLFGLAKRPGAKQLHLAAVLVTNDQAIRQMADLQIEDWTS